MNIARSIKENLAPIHKEGYRFILIFFVVSCILGLIYEPLFWLGMILTIWCAYFFRDPARTTPLNQDLIVSPADGRISWVGPAVPPQELGLGAEEMLRVSIFMDVLSVHVNRAPMEGVVETIVYRPGQFLDAALDKASEHNERNSLIITNEDKKIAVVQIAGLVARRILCWPKENDKLEAGERFGLIRFGSRVDVYMPLTAKTIVAVGQQAIAGETILGSFTGEFNVEKFKIG